MAVIAYIHFQAKLFRQSESDGVGPSDNFTADSATGGTKDVVAGRSAVSSVGVHKAITDMT
jgi:hypothetical protein